MGSTCFRWPGGGKREAGVAGSSEDRVKREGGERKGVKGMGMNYAIIIPLSGVSSVVIFIGVISQAFPSSLSVLRGLFLVTSDFPTPEATPELMKNVNKQGQLPSKGLFSQRVCNHDSNTDITAS